MEFSFEVDRSKKGWIATSKILSKTMGTGKTVGEAIYNLELAEGETLHMYQEYQILIPKEEVKDENN
jgi:predicted RNase H-like HicB family nuclease